jgi:AraC-like DNA-binding protein
MHSLTIQPSQVLQTFVRHIEILENDQESFLLTPLPFYADGCPGLIYQQTDNGMLIENGAKKLSAFFVYGQTVKPVEFLPQGAYRMIIFYFYPHIVKSLYGINTSEITDTCLDLTLLRTPGLMESIGKLQDTQSAVQQVEIISNYLTRIILTNKMKVDTTVQYAISHIVKHNGQTSLRELRTWLKVSERTFERKFEQYVGVNAKLFARICQFQSSLAQLHKKDFSKLSDLAYDNGYADQSHFIRSFKAFTGLSPLEFKKLFTVAEPEEEMALK